jgi:LacI family repressor for deo operon, udp, cdd, tsx, nupC, and nupG
MRKLANPKIKDVARVAGVSTATVSRTLSKPETVAEKTRKLVLDAAEKTGYRINIAARNLRRQKTGAVVVLVPNLGNPFFSEILSGIVAELAKAELSVLVFDTKQADVKPELVFDYVHRSRADGIISLDGSLPQSLLSAATADTSSPPIVFACEWSAVEKFPSVRADNALGARLAVRHLNEMGHQKIGHICGPEGNVLTAARRAGMMEGMKSLGLPVNMNWFFKGDFTMEAGVAAARQWLAVTDRPTAIFAASDSMAFGFISELHRNGVRVPEDVSVMGFDDINIAGQYIPSLTTIHQPRNEIGSSAARLLVELIDHDTPANGFPPQTVPVELIVRESTANRAEMLARAAI